MTQTPRPGEGRYEEPGVPGRGYTTPSADPAARSAIYAPAGTEAFRPATAPSGRAVDEPDDPILGEAAVARERERDPRSLGEIASDLMADASRLIRQEVELAKAEVRQTATRTGKGAGLFGGAGVAGWFALLFLSLAIWWGLAVLIGTSVSPALGWSGLILAVVYAIVAGVLAASGRTELKKVRGMPRTAETVSKIPNAVKGHEEMNR